MLMSYRELAEKISVLTEEQKNMTVTFCEGSRRGTNECFALRLEMTDDRDEDALGEIHSGQNDPRNPIVQHPFLMIV